MYIYIVFVCPEIIVRNAKHLSFGRYLNFIFFSLHRTYFLNMGREQYSDYSDAHICKHSMHRSVRICTTNPGIFSRYFSSLFCKTSKRFFLNK